MVTIQQLLNNVAIAREISRVRTPQSRLQDFYGLGPAGANTIDHGGKQFGWDIFDHNRDVATIRAPDTCLLYTSPSPRDATLSRMPSSA